MNMEEEDWNCLHLSFLNLIGIVISLFFFSDRRTDHVLKSTFPSTIDREVKRYQKTLGRSQWDWTDLSTRETNSNIKDYWINTEDTQAYCSHDRRF